MKMTGEYRIAAPRNRVWDAINDPEILQHCIPGCEAITRNTPTNWTARVTAKVGPVKARFQGNIRLEDLDPPSSCRIVGEGSGGAAGFARGEATVQLDADGTDATVLRYTAQAQVGGKLAQIGSRLIDSFAQRYADDFFAQLAAILGGERDLAVAAAVQPEAPAPSAPHVPADAEPGAAVTRDDRPDASFPASAAKRFDSQSFTIVVLSLLLVFMTVMYALKP
ncbi:carbon monoxide dehydrogenase subunit G [Sandarakinorhabdus sp. AAP62]|uniref:CoxG family protein n=1 Tax=Sandarakinorhabdus sp. AAP62 TaxID=1248916 RepID=UPI00031EE4FB|nr:carbon monoxide dehydrogenase subunit G [Sandarakinorhabdus sp. AAP62]